MTEPIIHFFASGNTSKGFASVLDSVLEGADTVVLLQGNPGVDRGSFLGDILKDVQARGLGSWVIHSPSDNNALDGIVLPELRYAIISDTALSALDASRLTGSVLRVDFTSALNEELLSGQQELIQKLHNQIEQMHEQAYAGFAEALRIHDDWEAIYIANMSFAAADRLTQAFIKKLYGDERQSKISHAHHRFLGAATPLGAVDFVPNLTAGLKRYLIKGRAGSGKSTFLKKIAAEGLQRGYDIEFYHCGFDPGSLDMIISRELGIALFDSTAPHEYFPDRPADEIVDMYEHCIKPGTDEKHADAIRLLKEKYGVMMKQSISKLAGTITPLDEIKKIYASATDYDLINNLKADVLKQLDSTIQSYMKQ